MQVELLGVAALISKACYIWLQDPCCVGVLACTVHHDLLLCDVCGPH